MSAPLILYIDTTRKVLVANFTATVSPGGFSLEQGDNLPVQLHFLQLNTASTAPGALPYSYIDPSTVTPVSMAVGAIGQVPTAGTFTVTFGADTTAALAFNITAAALSTAINALASVVSAGGVTVTGNAGGPWTIVFTSTGAQSNLFAVGAGELVPPSLGLTAKAVPGAVGVQEQQVVTLVQIPASVQTTWTPVFPAIDISQLQAGGAGINEIQRITIPTATYAGAFALTFGAKSTTGLPYNVTAAALQTALAALSSIGANNVNVIQSGQWTYDVTFVGALAGLSQALITANGTGLQSPMYLSAQFNLNVQGIFNLLTGLTSVQATLQIQQGTSGNVNTVVQMPVTVNAALILGTPADPDPADPWQTLSEVLALIAAQAAVVATTTTLGSVIVPTAGRLLVDGGGNISVPLASNTVFGVAKVDNTTIISTAGVLSVVSSYALPPATTTTLGGVIVPVAGRLSVDGSGNISVPLAAAGSVGVVSVPAANGLSVSGAGAVQMAQATAASFGTVQPDGSIITVTAGVITVPIATSIAPGVVQVDGSTIVISGGIISAANGSSSGTPTAKVGIAVVNGSATTFMRSDAAPPIDLTIVPTWSGSHTWTAVTNTFGAGGTGATNAILAINSGSGAGASPIINFNSNTTLRCQMVLGGGSGVAGVGANDFCIIPVSGQLLWVCVATTAVCSFSNAIMALKPTTAATSAGGGAFTNAGGASTSGSSRTQAGTSAKFAAVGGTLFDHFADVANGTTVETDLYSDSVVGNTLLTNGDKLIAKYGLTILASATATRQIRVYFGGTVIYNSGTLAFTASGECSVDVFIIRDSSTSIRYMIVPIFDSATAQLATNPVVGKLTGLTLSGATILKITGQSAGTGAASGDITAILGTIFYNPAV